MSYTPYHVNWSLHTYYKLQQVHRDMAVTSHLELVLDAPSAGWMRLQGEAQRHA